MYGVQFYEPVGRNPGQPKREPVSVYGEDVSLDVCRPSRYLCHDLCQLCHRPCAFSIFKQLWNPDADRSRAFGSDFYVSQSPQDFCGNSQSHVSAVFSFKRGGIFRLLPDNRFRHADVYFWGYGSLFRTDGRSILHCQG